MYELRRRWKPRNCECPLTCAVIASPLKIFWKQAILLILLGIAIGLLGMILLLFIPKARDQILIHKENISKTILLDRFKPSLDLDDIPFFSKMSYWRGNWAADNLFAYMATCKSDVKFF